MCSPLKKVLNKIEDSYQTYVNSYKTHAMATHHEGTGKPSEKDSDPQENDVANHKDYQTEVNDFENVEPDHHARLRDLTNEIDYLQQKSRPMKTILQML